MTGNIFTEIDLDKDKFTLIAGKNGSGKSTAYDAISYVLYNKTIKNLNVSQLINTMTQKDLLVEIEFETNKNHYMISRGIKPTIFEIYKDGVMINQNSEKKDYQQYLEKNILRINHKTFKQIVLLSSTNFVPFMQLPKNQRREVIEDLLDIQVFSVMNSLLKEKTNLNKSQIKDIDSQINIIKSHIKLNAEHIIELQKNNESIILEKEEKKTKIDIELAKYSDIIDSNQRKLESLEIQLPKKLKLEQALNKLNVSSEKCFDKIEKIEKEMSFYQKNNDCPICKQHITQEFKHSHMEAKDVQLAKLQTLHVEIQQKIKEKLDMYSEVEFLEKEILKCKNEILTNENRSLQSKNYKKDLEIEIQKLQTKNNTIVDDRSSELYEQLKLAEQDKNFALENRELYNVASLLLKDEGIKSQIIKQYVPTINKLIAKYLYEMEFDTIFGLDENFNEKITSRYKDSFSYESFSQGMKMRIDIALMLTWREISKLRNSVSTNILLMDEILDSSLDDQGNEDVLNILKYLIQDVNLFMISHKINQSDKFDKVITFKEERGFSRIYV